MALQITILSGGQSGVDRAALDAAIERGLGYRGWCPKGGWAEDLQEPPGLLAQYPHLRETPQADPAEGSALVYGAFSDRRHHRPRVRP